MNEPNGKYSSDKNAKFMSCLSGKYLFWIEVRIVTGCEINYFPKNILGYRSPPVFVSTLNIERIAYNPLIFNRFLVYPFMSSDT